MPANFPEFWLSTVEKRLVSADQAPWLDGIAEIANNVQEIEGGSESEQNIVYIPTTDFEVDILINNNSYPIPVQQYTDGRVSIQLDKYQTKQVPLSDDQTIGASYDLVSTATGIMTTNILEKKYAKAIHSMGPLHNVDGQTPVLKVTGKTGKKDAGGNDIIWQDEDGRLMLTHYDLVSFKRALGKLPKPYKWPIQGRRLVLCDDHYNDLLFDRDRFGDKLNDLTQGTVAPVIAGFQIYNYIDMPIYDGTDKLAFDEAAEDGQYQASIAFHVQNVGKKTGLTKQYFSPAGVNPGTQANTVAYRHYFICTPKRARYIAAIVSADAEA